MCLNGPKFCYSQMKHPTSVFSYLSLYFFCLPYTSLSVLCFSPTAFSSVTYLFKTYMTRNNSPIDKLKNLKFEWAHMYLCQINNKKHYIHFEFTVHTVCSFEKKNFQFSVIWAFCSTHLHKFSCFVFKCAVLSNNFRHVIVLVKNL